MTTTDERNAIIVERYARGDHRAAIAADMHLSVARVVQIANRAGVRRRGRRYTATDRLSARRLWAALTKDAHRTIGALAAEAGIDGRSTFYRAIHMLIELGYIRELDKPKGRHGRRYEVVVKVYGGAHA